MAPKDHEKQVQEFTVKFKSRRGQKEEENGTKTHHIRPRYRGRSPAASWKTRLVLKDIFKEALVATVSVIA